MSNKLIIFDIDGTLTKMNDVDSVLFKKAILDILPIHSLDTNWALFSSRWIAWRNKYTLTTLICL